MKELFKGSALYEALGAQLSRKGFLRVMGSIAALFALSSAKSRRVFAKAGTRLAPRPKRQVKTDCDLAVVKGNDPAAITRKAIDNLGGMARFVKKGDIVVVKPNIGWDRKPEQAANTNPLVVATVVTMCFEAGAKIVKVFDNTCNDARRTYQNTGIADAARRAGATVFYVSDWKFYPAAFPAGSYMQDEPVFRDAVECDCFINVPIAKDHRLTGLTLSLKNLMGVVKNRSTMHRRIDQSLVEVAQFIKPDLTVIDAYRVLLRNGPSGGDLDDVEMRNTVIAGADPVLADAYATTLFGMRPEDIKHVALAAKAGLGSLSLSKANIKKLTV